MPLTEQQRERRRGYVGASDVGAIMGVDPYRNAIDVWAEKVHGVDDFKSEPAVLGDALESSCIDLAMRELSSTGFRVSRANSFRVCAGSKIGVNLDAWLYRDDSSAEILPLECKTAGIVNPWSDALGAWGEAGTDEIPERYILQLHAQMMAVGASASYLSAIVAGRGHLLYHVRLNDDLASAVIEAVADFWDHVERGVAPDEGAPMSEDVLKRLVRRPETVCDLTSVSDAVVEWREAAKQAKEAAEWESNAKRWVLSLLGDCEGGLVSGGYTADQVSRLASALDKGSEKAAGLAMVSYLEQSRSGVDIERLKADFPEAYAACLKESRFRVLRLGKPKKGVAVNAEGLSRADAAAALGQ